MPARSSSAYGGSGIDSTSSPLRASEPGDGRVRVPHLAGAQLVAAPDGRRHRRHQLEQAAGAAGIAPRRRGLSTASSTSGMSPRASGGSRTGRAGSGPGPVRRPHPRRRHHAPSLAPDRGLLDHESPLGHAHLERRVVEVAALSPLEPSRRPLRRLCRSSAQSARRRRAAASRGRSAAADCTARHAASSRPSSASSKNPTTRCSYSCGRAWSRPRALPPRSSTASLGCRRPRSTPGSAPRHRRRARRRRAGGDGARCAGRHSVSDGGGAVPLRIATAAVPTAACGSANQPRHP